MGNTIEIARSGYLVDGGSIERKIGVGKRRLNVKVLTTALGGAAALAAYAFLIRPWHLEWGATEEEVKMTLPGDQLVEHPKLNATHAITIDAPVQDVWPWLVQL